MDSFPQINKPIDGPGEARQSGNRRFPENTPFLSKWASIVLITTGSSMLAMIFTSPLHSLQVSPKVGAFRRYRQGELMHSIKRGCPGVYQTHVSSAVPKSLLHGARLEFALQCRLLLRFFYLCLVWLASPLLGTYYSVRTRHEIS